MKNLHKSNWISVPQVDITLQRDLWSHQPRLIQSYFWVYQSTPNPLESNNPTKSNMPGGQFLPHTKPAEPAWAKPWLLLCRIKSKRKVLRCCDGPHWSPRFRRWIWGMFSSKGSNCVWLFQYVKHQKRSKRERATSPHTCFPLQSLAKTPCKSYEKGSCP